MNLLGLDNPPRANAKQGEQGDSANHQSHLRNLEGRANRFSLKKDQKIKGFVRGRMFSKERIRRAKRE